MLARIKALREILEGLGAVPGPPLKVRSCHLTVPPAPRPPHPLRSLPCSSDLAVLMYLNDVEEGGETGALLGPMRRVGAWRLSALPANRGVHELHAAINAPPIPALLLSPPG